MIRYSFATHLAMSLALQGPAVLASQPDECAIQSLILALAQAFTQNDADAIDALTAEDYSFVSPSGTVETRAQRTAPIRSRDLVYQSVHYDDIRVRAYGDLAVATALVSVKSRFKDSRFEGSFRSTLTFARLQGHWKLVASQATSVPRS